MKLASYKTMMTLWRAERRRALLQAGIQVVFVTTVLTVLGLLLPDGTLTMSLGQWIVGAFVFSIIMAIPVYLRILGPKPKPADVEANRALRRAAGMDDSVEDVDAH